MSSINIKAGIYLRKIFYKRSNKFIVCRGWEWFDKANLTTARLLARELRSNNIPAFVRSYRSSKSPTKYLLLIEDGLDQTWIQVVNDLIDGVMQKINQGSPNMNNNIVPAGNNSINVTNNSNSNGSNSLSRSFIRLTRAQLEKMVIDKVNELLDGWKLGIQFTAWDVTKNLRKLVDPSSGSSYYIPHHTEGSEVGVQDIVHAYMDNYVNDPNKPYEIIWKSYLQPDGSDVEARTYVPALPTIQSIATNVTNIKVLTANTITWDD